jgi:hypothetical protein
MVIDQQGFSRGVYNLAGERIGANARCSYANVINCFFIADDEFYSGWDNKMFGN